MTSDYRRIANVFSPFSATERLFREAQKRWEVLRQPASILAEVRRLHQINAVISTFTATDRLVSQANEYLRQYLYTVLDPPWLAVLTLDAPEIERLYRMATSSGAMDTRLQAIFDKIAHLQQIEAQEQVCRDIIALSRDDGIQQQEAIARLLSHMKLGLRSPRAARALRQRAASRHISPKDLLRTELFPTAMLMVNDAAAVPRRIRLGRAWITNDQGKAQAVNPKEITVWAFAEWWFNQVYRAAEAVLLDEAYPCQPTQTVALELAKKDALERLATPDSPSAYDSAQLLVLLRDDQEDPDAKLHKLLANATPRAQELIKLLYQGMSRNEGAKMMGITRSTVDNLLYRERKKNRQR